MEEKFTRQLEMEKSNDDDFFDEDFTKNLDDYDELNEKMPRIIISLKFLYEESRGLGWGDLSAMIGSFYRMADLFYRAMDERYDLETTINESNTEV